MNPMEIRQHFSRVEQSLARAATACEADAHAPATLRRHVAEWNRDCGHAREAVELSGDPQRVRACLDALARSGGRALRACRDGAVGEPLEQAVVQACTEIEGLRRSLA